MAKKKSKKKQQSADAILERAEKLFKKNSFQAALREYGKFEKINKNKNPIAKKVTGHIAVCRQEVAAIRAGELLKKARRFLKKGNSDQARLFFEQAFEITADGQIAEIIAGLKIASAEKNLLNSADQAETEGDYSAAAEFLDELYAAHPDNSLSCRRARCLVMAGQWQQAVAAYAEADCSETVDLYNCGFAQAQQEKYLDCLNRWQQIQSEDPDFAEQKETVLALFLREEAARLDEDSSGREAETRRRIQSLSDYKDSSGAKQLLRCCHSLQLARLWQENRVEEIGEMSDKTDHLNLAVLAVHARAAYIHMEKEGSRLPVATVQKFINFWLSAFFNPVSEDVPGSLLDSGLELVKKYAGYHSEAGNYLLDQWESSCEVLTTLDTLRRDGRIGTSIPLFTPALALQAGICEDIFLLIRDNEDVFPDQRRFLVAGARYSMGAAALLMVQNFDYDGALQSIELFDKDTKDSFVDLAVEIVLFACGLQFMLNGDYNRAKALFIEVAPLLRQDENLKKQLITVLDQEEDWDDERLGVCADILSVLQKNSPSEEIDHALCRVMTRRAVEMFNTKNMNVRVLVTSLEKAAALNPDDEFTEFQLGDARRNFEISALNGFLNRFKLSAAGNLAAKSEYPEVREEFFNFVEQICEQARYEYQLDEYLLLLRKMIQHSIRVDSRHPIIVSMEDEIAQKEML